jgi:hypothetical protein
MARGLDGERFVNTAIDVAQRDVERVHRGRESHATKLATATARTAIGYYLHVPFTESIP